MTSVLLKC